MADADTACSKGLRNCSANQMRARSSASRNNYQEQLLLSSQVAAAYLGFYFDNHAAECICGSVEFDVSKEWHFLA